MPIKEHTLSNGVKIISQEIPSSGIQSLVIYIGYGWRDESPEQKEYTHLLEHLMMGGSQQYSTEESLATALARTGSWLNASTSYEYLNISSEFLVEHGSQIIDLVIDKITRPIINEIRIDRELKVLNAEYRQTMSDPKRYFDRLAQATIFRGTDLAPTFGEPYVLQGAALERVRDFFTKRLNPAKMVVISVGGISHNDTVSQINERLSSLPALSPIPRQLPNLNPTTIPNQRQTKDTTYLRINFLTWPASDLRHYALALINTHLTKGFGSRLFQELRLVHGLTYAVLGSSNRLSDVGIYTISLSTHKPDETILIIQQELSNLSTTIDEAKLLDLKTQLLASQKRELLSSQRLLASQLGNTFLTKGFAETEEDYRRQIGAVTLSDIAKASDALSIDKAIVIRSDR